MIIVLVIDQKRCFFASYSVNPAWGYPSIIFAIHGEESLLRVFFPGGCFARGQYITVRHTTR